MIFLEYPISWVVKMLVDLLKSFDCSLVREWMTPILTRDTGRHRQISSLD